MKKILILALLFICIKASGIDPKMRLRGECPVAMNGEKMYLNGEGINVDSTIVKDGTFEFELKNIVPDEYAIVRINKEGKAEFILVYLDNYDTYLKLENQTYVLYNTTFIKNTSSGNPTQTIVSEINDLFMRNSAQDLLSNPEIKAKFTAIAEREDMATAYVMWKYASAYKGLMTPDKLKNCANKLQESVKQTKVGKRFIESYNEFLSLMPGAIAPDFTMNTPEEKPLKLSEFVKGKKVVLIDFWASWCEPCRKKNPEVLNIYNKFHDKGFDVLSVSLDDSADKWKKAIVEDKLVWSHVSELKGWKSEICKVYNFNGIPCLFLLDGEGRILACGDDLRKQLNEYVDKFCNK